MEKKHDPCRIRPQKMIDVGVLEKLEAGYAKLVDSDSKSLLKKHLTKDIFDHLKMVKTPSFGSTLLDVIQSGLENLDSGVGIYAPDAEAYTIFADLFDPIIEEYHEGFKKTDKHPPMDWGDASSLGNLDPKGEFIVSTRVRCGRSMEGYPFNPCLTEDQYKEMESKVSSTLSALEGELKGTFYPLTGMAKDVQQQLIDDHFLFKEGDRFLQAANACRYWPSGRGIYHNDAKTFLVWCNEEDHLRLISMQPGGDLGEVYRRLVNAVNDIEKRIPFSHNDRLGFLTFCPSNLGTTVRASVHIKLPKLAADMANLEKVAGQFSLQVRGTSGEHTEAEGGIYDISNKRRMGLTEYDAVKEMYDGLTELIKMERDLKGQEPDAVNADVLNKLEAGYAKLVASDSKSLLKKHLTQEIFDNLKTKTTPSFGSTLLDVIQSGLENLDSGVGIYAPDAEAYNVFADLFDPIIEEYHEGFKKTDKHPPMDWGDASSLGNLDPNGEFIVSTRVRCGRSMEGYPFNPCLTEDQYKEMETKVSSTLSALEGELKGTFYPLTGMAKDVQQQLIDDHFLFKEGDRFLQAANACRYWPSGRGIYHNDAKTFLVWCNEEDHLRLISMQPGGDLGEVYRRLVNAVNDIEKRIPFSHNDRLGFLTFCPSNLGTTVRASVHIKLPKLASDMANLEKVAGQFSLQVRGTSGEHTEAEGGVYDISNKRRMGLTEYDAVKEMYDGLTELIKMEREKKRPTSGCSRQAAKDAKLGKAGITPGAPDYLEKLESGYAKLVASDSKSLLKKHLTKEMFDNLKTKKTPSFGSTLLDVIESGLQNLDSGVGIYAPDAEAYTTFADLFDPIIEEYHEGFKKTDKHPPMDWGDASSLGNLDPNNEFIVSTRVRCCRSMEGYPFNPCLTEKQYKEMEIMVSFTLSALEGELKGTFYPLTGMAKDVQQQLIDDHFLFKEGDRFLQAANACRYWPSGRGIYHNDAKTFLVWCNEEDHLRLISMQPGGDLGEVYRRLINAVTDIEKRITFSRNDRLGFLTFCPSNLGTTIRASVHIKLPKLAADMANLEKVAGQFSLQVRGTSGEHTEAEGGVYDISNKRRMGLTEYNAVKEMHDGLTELIKMEREK